MVKINVRIYLNININKQMIFEYNFGAKVKAVLGGGTCGLPCLASCHHVPAPHKRTRSSTCHFISFVKIFAFDLCTVCCVFVCYVFPDTSRCPGHSVSSPVIVTWCQSGSSATGSHTDISLLSFLLTRWAKTISPPHPHYLPLCRFEWCSSGGM